MRMDVRRSSISTIDSIRNLPYYHSSFTTTDQVAKYIRKKAQNQIGSFLIRPSSRNKNILTVSVLCKDTTVRHLHIQMFENGRSMEFFLVTDKKFDSFEGLINYYSKNPVKNLEGVDNVYFRHPLFHNNAPFQLFRSPSQVSQNSVSTTLSRGGSSGSMVSLASSLPNGNGLPPPLPQRPRNLSMSASQEGSLDESDTSVNSAVAGMNRDRPPLPLPQASGSSDKSIYYSQARDITEDISQKLIEQLQMSERCECGIPRILAELPLGWTVHLSKDANTRGKLFFQSSEGVTSWTIPEDVQMQLTLTHKANLSKISPAWQSTIPKKTANSSSTSLSNQKK